MALAMAHIQAHGVSLATIHGNDVIIKAAMERRVICGC